MTNFFDTLLTTSPVLDERPKKTVGAMTQNAVKADAMMH